MVDILLGQAWGTGGGTEEFNLLLRLLRNQWRSGRQRRWRDVMRPAQMTALRKPGSVHHRRILGTVVDVVLCWDAHSRIGDLN